MTKALEEVAMKAAAKHEKSNILRWKRKLEAKHAAAVAPKWAELAEEVHVALWSSADLNNHLITRCANNLDFLVCFAPLVVGHQAHDLYVP